MTSIHDKAVLASEASEAAGAQGQFWEMQSLLFERQEGWAGEPADSVIDTFVRYADELGLDADRFRNDLESGAYSDRVEQAYDEAVELGLRTLLRLSRQANIKKYRGKLDWQGDLDDMRSAS